ncbi:MAG: TetR/AcrR family transcriptional regulator [Lachnospiraceae bacterium]|nr:TetR/AcrR family transcriptional regulator [Lachnospiraceae bacterium]
MAKAFSEEEKEQIKIRIMETALDLFHDKGTKSLSIQELTKRVGIAQGSFYSFWKDKDALVLDVMHFRAQQKLNLLEQRFPDSLPDPVGFLTEIIYVNSMDLMHKGQNQPVYSQSFAILSRVNVDTENRFGVVYQYFLEKLAFYWKEHGAVRNVDVRGLVNVFAGSFVLFSNSVQFDPEYFDQILKAFIEDNVKRFITL